MYRSRNKTLASEIQKNKGHLWNLYPSVSNGSRICWCFHWWFLWSFWSLTVSCLSELFYGCELIPATTGFPFWGVRGGYWWALYSAIIDSTPAISNTSRLIRVQWSHKDTEDASYITNTRRNNYNNVKLNFPLCLFSLLSCPSSAVSPYFVTQWTTAAERHYLTSPYLILSIRHVNPLRNTFL